MTKKEYENVMRTNRIISGSHNRMYFLENNNHVKMIAYFIANSKEIKKIYPNWHIKKSRKMTVAEIIDTVNMFN